MHRPPSKPPEIRPDLASGRLVSPGLCQEIWSQLWDIEQGKERVPDAQCEALAYAEDFALSPMGRYAAAAMRTGAVRLYDLSRAESYDLILPILPGSRSAMSLLCFSADDKWLATDVQDGSVIAWACEIHQPVELQRVGPSTQADLGAFSPQNDSLAVFWGSGGWIFATDDSHAPVALESPLGFVESIEFRGDGTQLLARHGAIVAVWNVATGEIWPPALRSFGERRPLRSVEYTEDLSRILVQTVDGAALLLDGETCAQIAELWSHVEPRTSVAVTPNGSTLVTAPTHRDHAEVWSIPGLEERDFGTHLEGLASVAMTPDGAHAATGSFDRSAAIWRVADQHRVAVLSDHDGAVTGIALSPDASRALTVSETGALRFWMEVSGSTRPLASAADERASAAEYSPDGSWVSTLCGKTLELWSGLDGDSTARLEHSSPVSASSFAPDSRTVLTGCEDGTATIWDLATHTARFTNHLPTAVSCLAFDREGRHIALGTKGGSVHVFELKSGSHDELPGHDSEILALAFSPDAARVVTSSADREIRVWDPKRRRELLSLGRTSDSCQRVWMTADGRLLGAVTSKGEIRTWDTDPAWIPIMPSPLPEFGR